MKTEKASKDLVHAYLKDIGRFPLLSHEQEIVMGKQVQRLTALNKSQAILQEELNRSPSLTDWAHANDLTEAELQSAIDVGQKARHQMLESNLRLVVSVATKYLKRNMEFLDLIQEGTLGMQRAIDKFDPSKGYRFSTYAYWWIRQAMTRAIAEQGRTIRLPIHVTERLNKIKKVQRQLSQELGRSASITEIAAALDLDSKQVREYLERSRRPLSIDVKIGEQKETSLVDLLEDSSASPEDYTIQSSLQQDLEKLMQVLTEQQRKVLRLRFGLGTNNPLTLVKVGEALQISRERVRKIERDALQKLRQNKGFISEYLVS